jgi:hypothetical protein
MPPAASATARPTAGSTILRAAVAYRDFVDVAVPKPPKDFCQPVRVAKLFEQTHEIIGVFLFYGENGFHHPACSGIGVEVRSRMAEANHAPAIPAPDHDNEPQQSAITQRPLILIELS